MIFLDLINLNKVRKAIIYIAFVIVFVGVQNMVLSHISILGAKAMIIPVAVVAIGLFEGGMWGGVFGLLTGILTDLSFAGSGMTFSLLYPAMGFFTGFLADFFINRRFYSYMIIAVPALALSAFLQILPLWAFRGTEFSAVWPTALFQCVWSLPFAPAAYYACKKISGHKTR